MDGKTVIIGPGRAGTTFLVRLLTRLGFDTGYEPYGHEGYNARRRAGSEHHIKIDLHGPPEKAHEAISAGPRVLKSPELSLLLKGFVWAGVIEISHAFIPVRDLDLAARSRLDVQLEWHVCPTDDYDYRVADQASVHAMVLGRALEACLVCEIPYTIIAFPRMVEEEQYCWDMLSEGLEMDRELFKHVYAELANPKQIVWR